MKHHPIQISVPQPCSEDWDKMTPHEQGRFCDSCRKCVVDFTRFTDGELYRFFTEHKGEKVCGRINRAQLNRPIQLPYQPHNKLYRWTVAAGLALVLTSAPEMRTFAKAPCTETLEDIELPDTPDGKNKNNADSLTISGYILAENNEPLLNAQVSIKGKKKFLAGTVTDTNGCFNLTVPSSDTAMAQFFVNYIGYYEYTAPLSSLNGTIHIKLESSGAILGLVDLNIIEHNPPLINKYESGQSKTIKSNEIEKGAY